MLLAFDGGRKVVIDLPAIRPISKRSTLTAAVCSHWGFFLTSDSAGSSMGLFTSREHAGRFIADDPFVVEGLAVPRILEWDVVRFDYADPASLPIGEGRQHR
jgi:hypothetical protein